MEFKDLNNVKVDIKGTLKLSDDIDYWLNNSLPIGPGEDQNSYPPAAYQNQTVAFILGGKKLWVEGHGYGTFHGNGQAWYDFVKGESNYPTEDSYFHGLRFIKPQMWTVTIVGSSRLLLEDIHVHAASDSRQPARNTDGANTMFSDSITFRRWTVQNGDDCIAAKANSTNILIEDTVFHKGQGVAIGSIGQYMGRFETVENVTNDWPPNGGGGGIGYIRNISWDNVTIHDGERTPLVINQCYTNVAQANCSTSTFDISDISYSNLRGTINSGYIAEFQCSRSQDGCDGVTMDGVEFTNVGVDPGEKAAKVKCSNVNEPLGFKCTN
ncbi:hypothetical protein N8T08_001903 [Aspergillus melleus]|uniref:Uncharacterized protein n=1 Tax=Aspergillus melleus TaxID=138277 RepID=A0ACC3B953_9EURO|nr:hypothetical protein N8T08_001903 [Aspergillus melleus]